MVFLHGACTHIFIFNVSRKLWEILGFFPVFFSIKNSTIKNFNSVHENKKEKKIHKSSHDILVEKRVKENASME